jgi:hypothetical protein
MQLTRGHEVAVYMGKNTASILGKWPPIEGKKRLALLYRPLRP